MYGRCAIPDQRDERHPAVMGAEHRELSEVQRLVPDDEAQRIEQRLLAVREGDWRLHRQLLVGEPVDRGYEAGRELVPSCLEPIEGAAVIEGSRTSGVVDCAGSRRGTTCRG